MQFPASDLTDFVNLTSLAVDTMDMICLHISELILNPIHSVTKFWKYAVFCKQNSSTQGTAQRGSSQHPFLHWAQTHNENQAISPTKISVLTHQLWCIQIQFLAPYYPRLEQSTTWNSRACGATLKVGWLTSDSKWGGGGGGGAENTCFSVTL